VRSTVTSGKNSKMKKDNKEKELWLFSDNFIKRSLSIFGYCLVGQLFVYLGLVALYMIIIWVAWIIGNLS